VALLAYFGPDTTAKFTLGALLKPLFRQFQGEVRRIPLLGTSVNKGKKTVPQARELVEAQGCELLFLPPYSPDLNPIEEAFSKMKSLLRRIGSRTREALVEAMERAICAVRTRDVLGFFEHCDYRIARQPL